MAWLYPWATREHCLYRLTFNQLVIYWRQGRINQKISALRIAGHVNGVDIDKTLSGEEEAGDEDAWCIREFGMTAKEMFDD